LNGNIIEHFVAKGIVTSLKGSLMIDNDDGTRHDECRVVCMTMVVIEKDNRDAMR